MHEDEDKRVLRPGIPIDKVAMGSVTCLASIASY